MTDQTPEVRAANAENKVIVLESMLREVKAITTGLTERCSQLAAERDIQNNDANQLRQILQNQNEQIKAKDEKIAELVAELADTSSRLPVPVAPAPRRQTASSN